MIAHLTTPMLILAFILAFMFGCEEKADPPKANVVRNKITTSNTASDTSTPGEASVEKKDAVSSEKTEAKIEEETLTIDLAGTYNPDGRIDPFQPLFQKKEEEEVIVNEKKKQFIPQTPLQMVDLSQLKVSGILNSQNGYKALVEEASGKGYIVSEGTYLGNRGGKIISIGNGIITVEEPYEDSFGNETLKKRELKINRPAGE